MSTQDQIGSISMNPLSVPTSQILADFSAGGGDEQPLKVRKPYTITKQRERWAEEEHKKFLEALQLYGRAWRRIEEHIGTKTAVQIRSHAQKFFSKVVRESDTDGNVKSVEIPPPRPKRKPAHPYPRKLGNTCGNGGLSIGKLERSLSPMKSGFEQENGSPTSVLSGVGSDTLGSLLSNIPSRCASPVTSAAGSNEQEASFGEENNPHSPSQTTTTEQVPYLKLFGKTVLVTDSNKPSSPRNMESDAPSRNFVRGGDFSLGLGKSNWSPWSGGLFPMFYPLPPNFGDITNPADARIIPLPWWGMYGNLSSYPFDRRQDESSRQSFAEPLHEKEQQRGCPWTDSNNASADEGGNVISSRGAVKRDRNVETDDSQLLRGLRSRSDASVRGFVPYKRCVVEKEAHGESDDGKGQSVGLCL